MRADFVPTVFTTEQLGRQMLKSQGLKGSKVLLLRSKRASGQLADILRKGGAIVEDKDIYTVRTKKSDSGQLKQQITSGSIDWLTFTSSSAAAAFFGHVSAKTVNSSKAKVASIGPMTTEELKKLGIKIDLEAKEHTIDGLLEAMVARRRRGG
jgi:uroporphyrinogen III methyltransferase/synthase